MYPIFIGAGLGSVVLLSLLLIPKEPFYISGPFLALVAFIPTFYLISRKMADKVRPFLEQAQKQAQAGKVDHAIQSYEKAASYRRWQIGLQRQINTQVGMLHFASGNDQEAEEALQNGYPKISEGHLVLGALLYRQKKVEEARDALEMGIRFNKKSPILYNFLAWMLAKEGQRDAAIEVLNRGLKKMGSDEDTSENLKRLQNEKKMNMKAFGQHWFMLKFETPKGMATQTLRKGFRQPPKQGTAAKKGRGKRKRK